MFYYSQSSLEPINGCCSGRLQRLETTSLRTAYHVLQDLDPSSREHYLRTGDKGVHLLTRVTLRQLQHQLPFHLHSDERRHVERRLFAFFASCQFGGKCPLVATAVAALAAQDALNAIACNGDTLDGRCQQLENIDLWLAAKKYSDTKRIAPHCDGTKVDEFIKIYGNIPVAATKLFLGGVGAIGCEILKCLAHIGLKHIVMVDGDTVAESNLHRQALFDSNDVGKPKVLAAMNKINQITKNVAVSPYFARLGDSSSPYYDNIEKDFQRADVLVSALVCRYICVCSWCMLCSFVFCAKDNIPSRQHMDRESIMFSKPLIDIGTLGPLGSVQVRCFLSIQMG